MVENLGFFLPLYVPPNRNFVAKGMQKKKTQLKYFIHVYNVIR